MAYRVDQTERAARNLRRIYRTINAEDPAQAREWFNGLEKAVLGLDENPARLPVIPEDGSLRHLLYGRKPNVYRIIYASTSATAPSRYSTSAMAHAILSDRQVSTEHRKFQA